MSDLKSKSTEPNQETFGGRRNDRRVKDRRAVRNDINIEYDESNVPKFIMAPSKERDPIAQDLFDSFIEYIDIYAKAADDEHRRKLVDAMRAFGAAQRNAGPARTFTSLAVAPELWKDRHLKTERRAQERRKADRRNVPGDPDKETPPEFIRRVYAEQIEQGMTQADLKRIDISAYHALHQYAQKHKVEGFKARDVLPSSLPSMSVEERLETIQPLSLRARRGLTDDEIASQRLYSALSSRKSRQKKKGVLQKNK